jgi:flagellar basal body-associated protein FliL
MAEEIQEGGGGGGDGGSALKKYGPLAAIVLLAQVVLAWVVIQFALKDNVPEKPQEALLPEQSVEVRPGGQDQAKARLPHYYSSDNLKITANPAGTNSERFVVMSVQLGLVAFDRDKKPPDDDMTSQLGSQAAILEKIGTYDLLMKSIVTRIIRTKTVDELEGEYVQELGDEIRKNLNKEVFERLFKIDDDNKIEVQVSEVIISDIIIQ